MVRTRGRCRSWLNTRLAGGRTLRRALVPLALAQFICSFAGSNMNVMINDISEDLDTTVQGVQIAITIFLLVMAALMIPGGKLTDRYGRKRLLHRRSGRLRRRCADERGRPGPGCADHRQLDPRGRRHGAADPARLHPHDAAVHRPHLAGPRVRRDQRDGRHRRRRRAADRRPDHLGDQLAGRLRLPGPGHRVRSSCWPAGSRSAAGRPDPPVRHRRRGPVGRRPRPGRHGHPGRGQQRLADGRPDRRRCPRPGLVLPLGAGQGARRARSRCCRRHCSATAPPTSASSRRTPSGCCSSGCRSWSRPTCRSCAATTRSRPA